MDDDMDSFTPAQKLKLKMVWRRVIINGRTYATSKIAEKLLGIPSGLILARCSLEFHDNYCFYHAKRREGWQLDVWHDRSNRVFLRKRFPYNGVGSDVERVRIRDTFSTTELREIL